ncbi:regulatory protein [Nitrosospira sp. Nl5]|uniref:recombination regulator RecX n=1 Tax=Nitrosospira sp. Nl5 TaxID=200120 RepID=UPI00087ED8E9|nr:recombination regulator RecX [Nitrosospira sp. Nl5]SCY59163.1 regulatory protein [Nitrosospira sp. Nl5]
MTSGPSLKTRALGYLGRREHSRLELERKLAPHAETSEDLSSVLDMLEQRGFLSATRMVEQVIHMRKNRFGSQRIVHELREKGIAENLIIAALPNIKETEQDGAREVWRKKFGAAPADAKEFARQMRFLLGRGFTAEVIRHVLRRPDKDEA